MSTLAIAYASAEGLTDCQREQSGRALDGALLKRVAFLASWSN
jgi:hypothetical protein